MRMRIIADEVVEKYQLSLAELTRTLETLRHDTASFIDFCGECGSVLPKRVIVESQDAPSSQSDGNVLTQVTATFDDVENEEINDMSVVPILYRPTASVRSDIAQFLSRPVYVWGINWVIGGSLDSGLNIWRTFFDNAAIQRKLDNYAFIRCDLHVKIMINASPFYYGAVLFSYGPLDNMYGSAPVNTSAADALVPYSQRPHVWVYPQTNEGAEMVLPFIYPYEWLDVTSGTDLTNFGRLYVDTAAILETANGTVGTSVDISVYAWCENVELAGLTTQVSVQSKDEYSRFKGPVSKPASAVARATGLLGKLPIVGPYMTATSIAADGIANISSLFGYSKVPVIENVMAYKNLPFHGLASSDISEPTEQLSVDSKNELTVNNQCLGDVDSDPLNIQRFCARSSYLTYFSWDATDATGTLLWNTYISPFMSSVSTGTGQSVINPTPMWVAANCFSYWRGDIILEFKVVCSQYHRGRLVIAWDPVGNVAATTSTTELCYTQIVDITESTNFSVRVPYTQRAAYLKTPSDQTATIYSTSALSVDTSDTVNGILTVRVRNEQTSPIASAPIQVLVTVRGAENLEFASPKAIDTSLYFYTVQSQDKLNGVVNVDLGGSSSVDPHINLVYMGEKVESFRSLLMRCNHTLSSFDSVSSTLKQYTKSITNRRPLFKGFDPNGIHEATGNVSAVAEPYNFVSTTPYHLISVCFIGERGSFTWKYDSDMTGTRTLQVSREPTILTAAAYPLAHDTISVTTLNGYSAYFADAFNTPAGAAMLNTRTNTGLSVNAPMYNQVAYIETSPVHRTEGLTNVTATDSLTISYASPDQTNAENGFLHSWFQVGPDYSTFFFLNVPTFYKYNTAPVYAP